MIPYVFIAGYANAGKTTVIENLVRELKSRGKKIATIKHAAHGYQMDPEGKDSYRTYQAGADQVIVAGPSSYTIHKHCAKPPDLTELLAHIQHVDLILIEGFKAEKGPKIEVYRQRHSAIINKPHVPLEATPSRLPPKSQVIALVTDAPLQSNEPDTHVPFFYFHQTAELADFITAIFHL